MTEIVVEVPSDTPVDAPLYIAGDHPALGNWRPDGLPLERNLNGKYSARIFLRPEVEAQFLVTRGSWRWVESARDGEEQSPRMLSGEAKVKARVAGWGRESIRYHRDFASAILGNTRTISVYLPPGYEIDASRSYPVLYLQDGQNLFDASTAFGGNPWFADETAERLIRAGTIEPLIIVGIANTPERLDEYGPKTRRGIAPGRDFPYARFIVEELKPFIDTSYLTLPEPKHTAIGGSSMGGLISLFLAQWYPDVFGRCIAMSSSLWWDRESVLRLYRDEPNGLRRIRFWIDTGTKEGATTRGKRDQVKRTKRLAELLGAAGLHRGRDFQFLEVHGAEHCETAWAARFDQVLTFLYKRKG